MTFTTIDTIVRSVLQQRQLPKHYYLQYLKYAVDCFRELRFDTLRIVSTRRLPVTETGIVQLPCDCSDLIRVGRPLGQVVKPLHLNDNLNRLDNLDSNGAVINYPEAEYGGSLGSTITANDAGEFIGRIFGYHSDLSPETYRDLPERNALQLNQSLGLKEVIIEYVSKPRSIDNCTRVDSLAQNAIESYMKWQASPNADNEYSPEAKKFTQSLRKLRARKNPMTAEDIRQSYRSGIKTIR